MSDDLILYGNRGWTSPYVFSVYVALKEKGVPFRLQLLDLATGEHRRPDYEASSWTGRVPALRHGDFWLAESSAIAEYLEQAFPPPTHARIYPEDARARAKARMVQAFLRSDLGPLRAERPTSTLFEGETPKPFTAAGKASGDRLVQIAERFLPVGARFVAGAFSIADADLALMLQRLVHNGDACPERLASYAVEIFERPTVREWLANTRWTDR